MELGGPFSNPVILAPLGTTFRAGLSQNCQLHATEEALSLLKGYLAKGQVGPKDLGPKAASGP